MGWFVLLAAAAITVDVVLLVRLASLGRRARWAVLGLLGIVAALVGGPFAYNHVIEKAPPPPLTFADLGAPSRPTSTGAAATAVAATAVAAGTVTTNAPAAGSPVTTAAPGQPAAGPASGSATGTPSQPLLASATPSGAAASPTASPSGPAAPGVTGVWTVGSGSQAGYRIDETVFGQTTAVVGRTSEVTGTMTIAGTTVTAARVVVNMQSVTCGCVHDVAYQTTLMDTARYPTSTFVLTQPIDLGTLPPQDAVVNVPVVGDFTIHGVTHQTEFDLAARLDGGRIEVNGDIPFNRSDYDISAPSSPGGNVAEQGEIELLLAFGPS
jgi:polyisoprenoid-binding protein YceI